MLRFVMDQMVEAGMTAPDVTDASRKEKKAQKAALGTRALSLTHSLTHSLTLSLSLSRIAVCGLLVDFDCREVPHAGFSPAPIADASRAEAVVAARSFALGSLKVWLCLVLSSVTLSNVRLCVFFAAGSVASQLWSVSEVLGEMLLLARSKDRVAVLTQVLQVWLDCCFPVSARLVWKF